MTQPSPTFRTTAETNSAIRVLHAELTAELGGRGPRLTFDKVIAAAAQVARNHRDEMVALLRQQL